VGQWWPKGLDSTLPPSDAVTFSRRIVAAAQPTDPAQAAQALAFCYRYALWHLENGRSLDEDRLFDPVEIDAYLAGPLATSPKGTRNPTRSTLRSLAPGSHLPSVRRRPAVNRPPASPGQPGRPADTDTLTGRPAAQLADQSSTTLADQVTAIIDHYAPGRIEPTRFERVAGLVRSAIKLFDPQQPKRAQDGVLWASYLACWVDAARRPLRVDVVFHPDTVEDFVKTLLAQGAKRRSAATIAALLRGISAAVHPTLKAQSPVTIGRAHSRGPYDLTQLDALLATANRLGTAKRRRYTRAIIAIGLATGASGTECASVRPCDVVEVSGQLAGPLCGPLHVTLRGEGAEGEELARVVVALEAYADLLRDVVTEAVRAKDAWLIGGGLSRRNRASWIISDIGASAWGVPLLPSRLRETYLVALASQSLSLSDLLARAGVTHPSALDRVMPYVREAAADLCATAELEAALVSEALDLPLPQRPLLPPPDLQPAPLDLLVDHPADGADGADGADNDHDGNAAGNDHDDTDNLHDAHDDGSDDRRPVTDSHRQSADSRRRPPVEEESAA
jgi:hypothetical protein